MSSATRRGSFWPTTTQRGLLEVALGPAEQAAARWEELQPLDVATLEAGGFGLLPLVYERLHEVAPDDPQLPRLLGTYRNVWYRNQLLLDQLSVLLPLLRQRAHVDPLLVGGMSALVRWYPRLGLRPVPQLELIVEREAGADAVKVAGYAGWRPSWPAPLFTRLRDAAGRMLVIHHGAPPWVAGPLGHGGFRDFRERAPELEAIEGAPRVLDAADELLFLCATGARTIVPSSCQWLVDVHHLVGSQQLPEAEEVVARGRRLHLVEPLRATLGYLAELSAADGLGELLDSLAAEPTSRRDRVAFTLSGVGGPRLMAPAQTLATHLRATGDEPLVRVVTRFPRSLQETWGASSSRELPALAVQKAARLFRRPAQASPPERSRSASS